MRAAAAFVVILIPLSGCGSGESAQSRERSPTRARNAATEIRTALPRLARDLIPDRALRTLRPGTLKVEECGITPVFPCTNAFFAVAGPRGIEARISALQRLAKNNAWHVQAVERFATGAFVDLFRGDYHARYTMEQAVAPDGTSFVQLQVYGPATELPRPSLRDQRQWSEERRRYVRRANAICARTLAGLTHPHDLSPVLAELAAKLAVLEPPRGEEDEVQRLLRPLRNLVKSARALQDDKGEDALPAVVGVGEFTKRFVAAASRYGLTECALG